MVIGDRAFEQSVLALRADRGWDDMVVREVVNDARRGAIVDGQAFRGERRLAVLRELLTSDRVPTERTKDGLVGVADKEGIGSSGARPHHMGDDAVLYLLSILILVNQDEAEQLA